MFGPGTTDLSCEEFVFGVCFFTKSYPRPATAEYCNDDVRRCRSLTFSSADLTLMVCTLNTKYIFFVRIVTLFSKIDAARCISEAKPREVCSRGFLGASNVR